jgi:hypothetical protein
LHFQNQSLKATQAIITRKRPQAGKKWKKTVLAAKGSEEYVPGFDLMQSRQKTIKK